MCGVRCMVEGCGIENPLRICERHWEQLSWLHRVQWMRESNVGVYEPTKTLVGRVNEELKPRHAPNLGVAVVKPFVETEPKLLVVWS